MRATTCFLVLCSFVALYGAATAAPVVCRCNSAGTCAPAQLVLVESPGQACPLPVDGVLNASVVTNSSTDALKINLTGVTRILGYLSVVDAPRITTVLAPDLLTVGAVKVRSNPELVSLNFPTLTHFEGETEAAMMYQIDVRTNAKLNSAGFPSVKTAKGITCEDVNLTNPCDLTSLISVDGDYHMKGGNHGSLHNVSGHLSVSGVDILDLPALTVVGKDLRVTFGTTFERINVPALAEIGGAFVGTTVTPFTNSLCTKVSFPKLASVGADFTLEGLNAMTNFSANALVNATGKVKLHGEKLKHVYLEKLEKIKAIDIQAGSEHLAKANVLQT